MRLVPAAEVLNDVWRSAEAADWPLPLTQPFVHYVKQVDDSDVLIAVSNDGRRLAPIRMFRNRVMRLGQLLFPPVERSVRLAAADEHTFIEELIDTLRGGGACHRLIQPPNYCLFQVSPRGSRWCEFGSFVLRLEGRSEDDLLRGMHSHHRHVIRKAIRWGAKVRFGRQELPVFHRIHAETMKQSGLAFEPLARAHAFVEHLSPARMAVCAVVYDPAGQALGGLLVGYTRYSAFYLHGGSISNIELPGAIRLLHWETIRRLMAEGVRQYDFVGARLGDVTGTKLESIQRFKARFGCEMVRGQIWKMDVARRRTALYESLNVIRHGWKTTYRPYRDIIDQEIEKGIDASLAGAKT